MKRLLLAAMMVVSLQAADHRLALFNAQGQELRVAHELTDSTLKQLKPEHMAAFLQAGNYVKAHELSDGSYRLEAMGRLQGGGATGAIIGAWVGRFVGYGIVYGIPSVVLFPMNCVPGGSVAYTATMSALIPTLAPVAEATATVFAIAGGITGGAATGPV